MTEYIVVYITAPHEEEAAKIAGALLEAQLAACVNIVRHIRSLYRWQGRIEDEQEVLMIVKTKAALFEDLMKRVRELHSYSVPEIVALPIAAGSKEYLKWLHEETQ